MTEEESLIVSEYANKILELFEDVQADFLTQSDLQGAAMGIVISIINELKGKNV